MPGLCKNQQFEFQPLSNRLPKIKSLAAFCQTARPLSSGSSSAIIPYVGALYLRKGCASQI